MTAAHIFILAAFIFLGGAGLAAIQEALILSFRSIFQGRTAFSTKQKNSKFTCKASPAR